MSRDALVFTFGLVILLSSVLAVVTVDGVRNVLVLLGLSGFVSRGATVSPYLKLDRVFLSPW